MIWQRGRGKPYHGSLHIGFTVYHIGFGCLHRHCCQFRGICALPYHGPLGFMIHDMKGTVMIWGIRTTLMIIMYTLMTFNDLLVSSFFYSLIISYLLLLLLWMNHHVYQCMTQHHIVMTALEWLSKISSCTPTFKP